MPLALTFLVGGRWIDEMKCGLWCFTFDDASSIANVSRGARLIIWDLMCLGHSSNWVRTLVGGAWNNDSRADLWLWSVNVASSNLNSNCGARLIIFKIHIKGFGVFGTGVYLYISFSSCRR